MDGCPDQARWCCPLQGDAGSDSPRRRAGQERVRRPEPPVRRDDPRERGAELPEPEQRQTSPELEKTMRRGTLRNPDRRRPKARWGGAGPRHGLEQGQGQVRVPPPGGGPRRAVAPASNLLVKTVHVDEAPSRAVGPVYESQTEGVRRIAVHGAEDGAEELVRPMPVVYEAAHHPVRPVDAHGELAHQRHRALEACERRAADPQDAGFHLR